MKENLKFLEQAFTAAIIWPVLGFGVFKIMFEILHFPIAWYSIVLMTVLVIYLGIKVGIGERI